MEVGQDMSGNETENVVNAEEVMGDLGVPQDDMAASGEEPQDDPGNGGSRDTLSVQKRLKAQRRAHDREMREMQSRIEQMQSMLQQGSPMQQQQQQQPSFGQGDNQNPNGMQDAIHQAVTYALQQKEMAERQVRESEAQQHIAKQYADLNRHLDTTSDKYDDFDDVVRGDVPFTAPMRDAALMLPKKGQGSAGEVLYRLGKNPEELARIAKLHPVDQASELVALSHALISGGEQKQQQTARPLGQIKSNPIVNATHVNDKTPISELRNRMKKGTFK